MNKYLEKIAEKNDGDKIGTRLGKDLITTVAISTPSVHLSNAVEASMKRDLDQPGVGKVSTLRKMKKDLGLDFTFSKKKAFHMSHDEIEKKLSGKGPGYLHHFEELSKLTGTKKNFVHTGSSKNIGVIAHEMGHAASAKGRSPLYHAAQGVSRVSTRAGLGGLVGTGMLMSDKTKDKAWMAPVVTAAPMLFEEANANRHAYKAFLKHEGRSTANKFLKHVVSKNTLNYHLPVAGSALALAAASKWIKSNSKKDNK